MTHIATFVLAVALFGFSATRLCPAGEDGGPRVMFDIDAADEAGQDPGPASIPGCSVRESTCRDWHASAGTPTIAWFAWPGKRRPTTTSPELHSKPAWQPDARDV